MGAILVVMFGAVGARGGVGVALVGLLLMTAGCVSSASPTTAPDSVPSTSEELITVAPSTTEREEETNPACSVGQPYGADVELTAGTENVWSENPRSTMREVESAFVGTVVAIEPPEEVDYCVNLTVPSQQLTVNVDEVLYGPAISGEVPVLTKDTTTMVSADPDSDSQHVAIFFVNPNPTGDGWEAYGVGRVEPTNRLAFFKGVIDTFDPEP